MKIDPKMVGAQKPVQAPEQLYKKQQPVDEVNAQAPASRMLTTPVLPESKPF